MLKILVPNNQFPICFKLDMHTTVENGSALSIIAPSRLVRPSGTRAVLPRDVRSEHWFSP